MRTLHFIIEESTDCYASIQSVHRTREDAFLELMRLCSIYQDPGLGRGNTVYTSGDGLLEVTHRDGSERVFRYQHLASEAF